MLRLSIHKQFFFYKKLIISSDVNREQLLVLSSEIAVTKRQKF